MSDFQSRPKSPLASDHCGGAHSSCCAADGVSESTPAPRGGRTFRVHGLDCAEEVAVLKHELAPLLGGPEFLHFDVLNGRLTVADEARPVTDEQLQQAVAATGMRAQRWDPSAGEAPEHDHQHRTQILLTTLSGLAVLSGLLIHVVLAGGFAQALRLFGGHDGHSMPWPEVLAYASAVAFGARYVLVKAWHAARRLRPDINLLMVIAVIGAAAIDQWFEAGTVMFLFALSLLLESWSVGRARRAVAALLDLAPPVARIKTDQGEHEVAVHDVPVGAHVIVMPGERIPVDARVVTGDSAVNQAPITGESAPVRKQPGAKVFAGTINGDGALEMESLRAAEDSTLARIIRLVEQAHSQRARAEQWVERFARYYTPIVMLLALAVFVLPPLLFGAPWQVWFYRSLVLLVIACPCALVISTPVSIVAALCSAARAGVLVKGGIFIEQPAKLNAIAFDKTGTLTRGEPTVVGIYPLDAHTEHGLLRTAAALEQRSGHALARAVLAYAGERGISPVAAEQLQVLQGRGATGNIDGQNYWLGSHRYLVERGADTPELAALAQALQSDGKTVVAIGNDAHVCGLIAVADTVRVGARETVQALRAAGIGHIIMLTGDNRVTAETIGRQAGIDQVHAELLPEDKLAVVERLVSEHGTVAMVGDGVNDAPAMARAGLGIAMGAAGTDAAIETADIALMTDDLSKIPWLVDHSRRTVGIIRQNIVLSLAIKLIFVVLTFFGLATLWGAIAADEGVALLVVFNSLRLLGAHRRGLPQRTPVSHAPVAES